MVFTIEMGTKTATTTTNPKQTGIKCSQVNLQHSKAAAASLLKAVEDD
jgi:hypothetical protein